MKLYSDWERLADLDGASMADIRLAWANYKAHRANCRECDPVQVERA